MNGWETYRRTMVAPASAFQAAKDNDVATLRALRDGGADLDARDPRGYSPLMLAAYAGHVEALDWLIAEGADPNTTDHAGNTPLMGAAFKGNIAVVERLLAAGAFRNLRNVAGLDALDFARAFGRREVADLLER